MSDALGTKMVICGCAAALLVIIGALALANGSLIGGATAFFYAGAFAGIAECLRRLIESGKEGEG